MITWNNGRGHKTGYQCSSRGDKRFSALYAKLPDGRTIEEAYQIGVKGYPSIKEGKGKPPIGKTKEQAYSEFVDLWRLWAKDNNEAMSDLRTKATEHNNALSDQFAKNTPDSVNQARALAQILNETSYNVLVDDESVLPILNTLTDRERDIVKNLLSYIYDKRNREKILAKGIITMELYYSDEYRQLLKKNILSYCVDTFKIRPYPTENYHFELTILPYFGVKTTTIKQPATKPAMKIDITKLTPAQLSSLKEQIATLELTEKNYEPCLKEVEEVCAKYKFTLATFIDLWTEKTNNKPQKAVKEKKTRTKITPELKEAIGVDLKGGEMTDKAIAEKHGVSVPSIQGIKKSLGLVKAKTK